MVKKKMTGNQAHAMGDRLVVFCRDNPELLPDGANDEIIGQLLDLRGDAIARSQFDVFLWHLNRRLEELSKAQKKNN